MAENVEDEPAVDDLLCFTVLREKRKVELGDRKQNFGTG
jgi:hypothetical protein